MGIALEMICSRLLGGIESIGYFLWTIYDFSLKDRLLHGGRIIDREIMAYTCVLIVEVYRYIRCRRYGDGTCIESEILGHKVDGHVLWARGAGCTRWKYR